MKCKNDKTYPCQDKIQKAQRVTGNMSESVAAFIKLAMPSRWAVHKSSVS